LLCSIFVEFIIINFAGFCSDGEVHFELGNWYQVKSITTHTAEDIFGGNVFSILVAKIHLYIWVVLYFLSSKIISSSTPPLFAVILLTFSMERANRSKK